MDEMDEPSTEEGNLFFVADPLLLVDHYQALLAKTFKTTDEGNEQIAFLVTFEGRINNTNDAGEYSIALSPEDAFGFLMHCRDILQGWIQEGGTLEVGGD